MGYRALFSYARADDKLANWLHRQLDTYRTPKALVGTPGALGPVPAKLHPIFRDRTDLKAGGHIDGLLQQALEDSEALVILCTPASAKSFWVNHECETFLRLGREARLFPVIAAGEPESADPELECFPPALRGRGLLAADLREEKRPNGQIVGDGREIGRLKLIAGLLGVELDQLVQRERRRQRRLTVGLGLAAAVFALVAIAAIVLGVIADRNARTAEQRAAILSIASSRAELANGDVNAALLLLLEASKSFDAENAPDDLLIAFDEALQRANAETMLELKPGSRLFPAPFGAIIASPTGEISVMRDAKGPRPFGQAGGPVLFAAAMPGGETIVAVREDRAILRLARGAKPQRLGAFRRDAPAPDPWDEPFGMTSDGAELTARSGDGEAIFDLRSRSMRPVARAESGDTALRILAHCGVAIPSEMVARIVDEYGRGAGTKLAACTPQGRGAAVVTGYSYGSGGEFRQDFLVRPEAVGFYPDFDDPDFNIANQIGASGSYAFYLNGPLQGDYGVEGQSWAGARQGWLGMAVGRNLALVSVDGELVETTTPGPIVFAAFLSDGMLALTDNDSSVRLFDPDRSFAYNRKRMSENPAPVSDDRPSSPTPGASAGSAKDRFSDDMLAMFAAPDEEISVSSDRRYLLYSPDDWQTFQLLYLKDGKERRRIPDIRSDGYSRPEFVGDSNDVLVVGGNTVSLLSEGDDYRSSIIYRGDRDVGAAELSNDRKYLLVTENLGGSYLGGLVYSVPAQRVWRRLGTDYKWYSAHFSGPRSIDLSSERKGYRVRLHTFREAVAAATAALDAHCTAYREFLAADYTASPCWPKFL